MRLDAVEGYEGGTAPMRGSGFRTVIGIDPGLSATGYGILRMPPEGETGRRDDIHLVEAGILRTRSCDALETRLLELHANITELFQEYRPDVVAVEDLFSQYRHPRTAILMGHGRGVILLTAARFGAAVHHFPPARIKLALTGTGSASKRQIQWMVRNILSLDRIPEPDHVADALAVALCYRFSDRGERRV